MYPVNISYTTHGAEQKKIRQHKICQAKTATLIEQKLTMLVDGMLAVYIFYYGLQFFSNNFAYGSGHETVAVLLPGFAINW